MKEFSRDCVSGRFTVKPPALLPLMTSKPEEVDEVDDVGDVVGDEEGDIAVLIFVVMARRIGILAVV